MGRHHKEWVTIKDQKDKDLETILILDFDDADEFINAMHYNNAGRFYHHIAGVRFLFKV